jgi:hypothetical protein
MRTEMESYGQPDISVSQGEAVVRMQELVAVQQQTTLALFGLLAGGDRPPDEAFERYLPLARRLVAGVAEFDTRSPGNLDVAGVGATVGAVAVNVCPP